TAAMTTSMSTTSAPSTTYTYSYTTFTNASPEPFTTPTAIPSMFPWGGLPSSACPVPSNAPSSNPDVPYVRPDGKLGSCVISNVESVNDHSFWDMYDCCKTGKMTATGATLPCTSICYASEQRSFLEIGECLSKRNKIVVCSSPEDQRGEPKSESSGASQSRSSASATKADTTLVSARPTATTAQSAANAVAGGQGAASKAGLVVFGFMALSSAVGMLL
ncbi:hypothetical protein COCMIDRAFT_80639, partial [Bipolaris oryzae ATCC 44560]